MLSFRKSPAGKGRTKPPLTSDVVRRSAAGELTLIDVRDIREIAQTGKAAGALHIPLMTLRLRADPGNPDFHPNLDPEKPVAIYCATGARSNMAVTLLTQLGYRSVMNLGGLSGWVAAGGAIER